MPSPSSYGGSSICGKTSCGRLADDLQDVAVGSHGHRFDQRRRRRVLTGLHLRHIDQELDHVAQRGGVLRGVACGFTA